ncbi:hypothetical protein [Phytoactinopolyspora mesophila]|uniref:Uncharacterized protein n=1 Tax=Phytoactinopolyspora mesophila TaxID=2650750 RepID=A0A7K3M5V8_9ACTN|nr:hypothetical protein [Phytoactinopolyspora mesophila]NDL58636.1 hypothetical protein [Phytoactinopolyspora mesophila]
MAKQIVRVKPRDRQAFARWLVANKYNVRTVSSTEFGLPVGLLSVVPEYLLMGAIIDSRPYRGASPSSVPATNGQVRLRKTEDGAAEVVVKSLDPEPEPQTAVTPDEPAAEPETVQVETDPPAVRDDLTAKPVKKAARKRAPKPETETVSVKFGELPEPFQKGDE